MKKSVCIETIFTEVPFEERFKLVEEAGFSYIEYINYIGYIHIADVPGRHEPGTGEINFSNIFNVLNSLKYGGFIGFELFPSKASGIVVSELLKL
ncbi:hydroxypyruvate isomerase [Clostridium homopropionicum DSM 5847]|uniref:Hydroxypyruvate isomerase n=1 Tax=Clostridium homopropionicum DSM 5847 TaxID=1121318 RepID=A0A0L6Z881_9CLOT|nr:TIM barrel protein [Clostridium homopropionicum]KOA19176.1 hydroxypyruvate isomerase [Clostridium homopropionicum DSM 5847]SFG16515.1 hydroxypyruvate isomerase [Clostridium homopropionicum]